MPDSRATGARKVIPSAPNDSSDPSDPSDSREARPSDGYTYLEAYLECP